MQKHKYTTETFIEKAREIHGDTYDYSKTEYVNIKTKVCIICPEHGEFWQEPRHHLEGRGCPICARNLYWTYERCLEEAKKYTMLSAFHDKSNAAYNSSRIHGWIEDFSWLKRQYGIIYTFDELKEIASYCLNRAEFKHKNCKAYNQAKEDNVLDLLFPKEVCLNGKRVSVKKKIKKKLTYEHCYSIAKKYEFLSDFRINEPSVYTTSVFNGWLKDYTWLKKGRNYYTEEEAYSIAKKYETKIELYLNDNQCYHFLYRHDLLKNCTWFKDLKSLLEKNIERFLIKNNIKFETQKKFEWLRYKKKQSLDFFLPDYNVAIECQGKQHFGINVFPNAESGGRTKIEILDEHKNKLCNDHGIKIYYYANYKIDFPYKVYTSIIELINTIKNENKKLPVETQLSLNFD